MPEHSLADCSIGLLTASASRLNGGVFEAVVAHASMLRDLGANVTIFALSDAHTDQDRRRFGSTPVVACDVRGPRQIGWSPALQKALLDADLDCLHLHGIWMYPSRAGLLWTRRTGKPLLVSPHGMLDPWIVGRGRWKKALARYGYEHASWRAAWTLHGLTPRETLDIAREAGRNEVLMIPNAAPPLRDAGNRRGHDIVYLGRIHAKKNLLPLVAAWQRLTVEKSHPADARLMIGGWGAQEDIAALQTAIARAPSGIEFLGPVYDQAKEDLLSGARFMVLPSLSEGLPMAILEAWAHGTPTLMTRECNLDEGFVAGAALDCGFDESSIAAALGQAWALDQRGWDNMRKAACALAAGPFSTASVAARWADAYHRAMGTSPA